MNANKMGLRAPFRCNRVWNTVVEPTGEVVEQNSRRYQRIIVRARRKEPRFMWVPLEARRADIDAMLEAEKNSRQVMQ